MTLKEIDSLFERMQRINESIQNKGGKGAEWEYTFPDGLHCKYTIKNIRSPDELEDCISNLCLWVWNMKDYIKEYLTYAGKNPKVVEEFVNEDPNLPICADLANGLKHGRLKKSRSGENPTLGRLNYSIPQTSIGKLVFFANQVVVDVSDPNGVDMRLPVYDSNGQEIGNALDFLKAGIASWEKFLGTLNSQ